MILYRFVVVYILLIFYDYHIIFHCMWINLTFFPGYFIYVILLSYIFYYITHNIRFYYYNIPVHSRARMFLANWVVTER